MINDESLKNLEKLHQLKTDGVITVEDFEAAKQRMLTAPARATASSTPKAPIERPADDNHVGWMLLPLKRYAEFTGRSSRKEFWMFLLFTNLIGAALAIVALADTSAFAGTGPMGVMAFGLILLWALGMVVPLLAVEVRRFNDQGKSGWFALLNLVPYIGPIIVLGFMLIPGVEGDNEFGPDPR